jgi:hypothetical protein
MIAVLWDEAKSFHSELFLFNVCHICKLECEKPVYGMFADGSFERTMKILVKHSRGTRGQMGEMALNQQVNIHFYFRKGK